MSDLSTFLHEVYDRLSPEQVYESSFDHKWHKSSSKWRGQCPWHQSKSGTAFYINTSNLTWYCPSCAIGGGPIQYSDRMNGGNGSPRGKRFIELAKSIGEMVGLELPERELTKEQAELQRKIETRRSILSTVVLYGQRVLQSERGAKARAYLSDRGFTPEDIENLNLGLYLNSTEIQEVISERGYSLSDAKEIGVLNPNLEGYILVPWNDENGRPLTLYGRYQSAKAPDGKPKTTALRNPGSGDDVWLKSKRSPLYFDRAREANHQDLIVVEGVFDAALLQARGDSRVIAWVAANPSSDQVETLARYKTKSVTFCLDPDGAGSKGTLQGIKHLTNAGITSYVAPTLPDGLDPDEFLNTFGIDGWSTLIEQSVHGFKFQAQSIVDNHQKGEEWSDRQLSAALNEAIAFDSGVSDDRRRADLASFFWPEFRALTGIVESPVVEIKQEEKPAQPQQKQPRQFGEFPSFHEILDQIDLLEQAIEDEDELEDAAYRFVHENGLRAIGWNGAKAIARARRRRERDDEIELVEVHELLARHAEGRKWLIPALIPLGSVVGLVSPGGGGKSSLVYNLVRHIATGEPWNGFKARQAKVLVVQVDEPEIDVRDKLDIANFYEVPYGQVDFCLKWRFSQTRQLKRKIQENGFKFVIVDSLTAANAGSGIDQNDTRSGDPIYALRDIANELECTFLVIHHCNAMGGVRGSTTFRDNVSELLILLAGDNNEHKIAQNQRIIWHNKSRAGLMGDKILLQQNPLDYSWIHLGDYGEPEAATWGGTQPFITQAIDYLEGLSDRKFSSKQLSDHFGQTYEKAELELERARRLGLVASEWVQHQRSDGSQSRFRVYFAVPEEPQQTVEQELSQHLDGFVPVGRQNTTAVEEEWESW